jgi:hypothetical protein
MTNENKPPPLIEAVRAVEFIAKYGAALGIAALATAFLFDSIFWWIVRGGMLGYFTLSDHIESAIRIIVVLVTYLVVITIAMRATYAFGDSLASMRVRGPKVAIGVLVLLFSIVLIYWLLVILGWPFVRWSQDAKRIAETIAMIAAILTVVGFLSLRRSKAPSPDNDSWRRIVEKPLPFVVTAWVLGACFLAIASGLSITDPDPSDKPRSTRDIVIVDNDAQLSGSVLRVIDKGVILLDDKDRRLMFIPKERIRRVDHNVPLIPASSPTKP